MIIKKALFILATTQLISAGCLFTFSKDVVRADSYSFSENFSTTTYRDAGQTTATWNTEDGQISLPVVSSNWTQVDESTLGSENISNTGTVVSYLYSYKIILDSEDNPYIVWVDEEVENGDIYFTKWNGSDWTQADGATTGIENVSNSSGASSDPQILIDDNDRPVIVWRDEADGGGEGGVFDIYLTRWNGSQWVQADGMTSGIEDVSNTLSTDSNTPRFRLDSDNNPIVVWIDDDGFYQAYFSKWNGSQWVQADGTTLGSENISNTTGDGSDLDIYLDSDSNPLVAWSDNSDGDYDIYFTKWNGSQWTEADGTTAGHENISNSSVNSEIFEFRLDSSSNPIAVWSDNSDGDYDIYFTKWNGSQWTEADGTTAGVENVSSNFSDCEDPKFALDDSDNPIIVWSRPMGASIHFTKWNGSQWTEADGTTAGNEDISLTGGSTNYPQLLVDSDYNPIVVWQDDGPGNNDTLFTKWNGSEWTQADGETSGNENISNNSGSSIRPSIVLDSGDNLVIAWDDNTPGSYDIFYTQYSHSYTSPLQAQSAKINDSVAEIASATLTATDFTPRSSSIAYYLSNNGGLSWDEIISGTEHDFSSAGDDLRWRAVLTTGSTPIIYSISVNYATQGGDDNSDDGNDNDDNDNDNDNDKTGNIEKVKNKPTRLTALAVSSSRINLAWKDNSKIENGYLIERKRENGAFVQINSINKNEEYYKDRGLEAGILYTYRVRGYKGNKYTPYSKEASAVTFFVKIIPAITPVIPPEDSSAPDNPVDIAPKKQDRTEKDQESKSYVKLIAVVAAMIGLVTGVATATAASAVPLFPVTPYPVTEGFYRLAGAVGMLGRTKKRKYWGVVFDSETRRPVEAVAVSIVNRRGKIAKTVYTNSAGRYGFLPEEGEYTFQAARKGYQLRTGDNNDILYGSLYSGQAFEAGGDKVIKLNIALKPVGIDWQKFAQRKINAYASLFSVVKRDAFVILYYTGLVVTALLTYFFPSRLNVVLLLAYIALLAYRIFFKRKSFGTIASSQTGKPIPFAVISIYDENNPQQRIAFTVSDVIGRYYLLIKNGSYLMKVQGQLQSELMLKKDFKVNVENGVVNENLAI